MVSNSGFISNKAKGLAKFKYAQSDGFFGIRIVFSAGLLSSVSG